MKFILKLRKTEDLHFRQGKINKKQTNKQN